MNWACLIEARLGMVAIWQCYSGWLPDVMKLHVNTWATIYHNCYSIWSGDDDFCQSENTFCVVIETKMR